MHWGCYYATALDIEVDPQRCCFGSRESDFALQAVVECRALEPECFEMLGVPQSPGGPVEKEDAKTRRACGSWWRL